ncbi:MAG TPA: PIN domain-containing protein, partial [Thermoanaerobaculia bacterium]|nr:PIN domain-containing protein [Thermoanaerobaculia bacterium]
THDAVLTELLTFFAEEGRYAREQAASTVRRILGYGEMIVVPADRALFLAALDRYAARPDKGYSLVDCMSMAVMERHGITHVLTNDHHFRQEGFVVVSDAP